MLVLPVSEALICLCVDYWSDMPSHIYKDRVGGEWGLLETSENIKPLCHQKMEGYYYYISIGLCGLHRKQLWSDDLEIFTQVYLILWKSRHAVSLGGGSWRLTVWRLFGVFVCRRANSCSEELFPLTARPRTLRFLVYIKHRLLTRWITVFSPPFFLFQVMRRIGVRSSKRQRRNW